MRRRRDERRAAETRARVARDALPVEWILIPASIVIVIAVVLGLKLVLG